MAQAKGFFASKLNWLGMLTALVALAQFADVLPDPYGKWVLAISGVATVILRTFGTTQPIEIGKVSA